MMDLYRMENFCTYTPDIEIEKRENKFGIVYLPTDEVLLPFEYENIIINGGKINNFFVVKNGKFGAIHFEGKRYSREDRHTERNDLPGYDEKPELVCDIPCEYDYFNYYGCGQSAFVNNHEEVYMYIGIKNVIIHFEEIRLDNRSNIWGRINDTLCLVSLGEIEYKEVFRGFRFFAMSFQEFADFDSKEKLVKIEDKYTLIKYKDSLTFPEKKLVFDDKVVNFEYYSKAFVMSCKRMDYSSKLMGIREANGTYITFPFAHTLHYVGRNRFIANCDDGKFGLCEIKYHGQLKTDFESENIYDWFPKFLLKGYDYITLLGRGYYEFIKDGAAILVYNANDGSIKNL